MLSQYLASFQNSPAPERQTGLRELLVETVVVEPREFLLPVLVGIVNDIGSAVGRRG